VKVTDYVSSPAITHQFDTQVRGEGLAAQGQTNPEIAESTGLARNTVETSLQSALHKLGARNRVEAIGKAGEAGLL
jgi:DNA-binding CsgD family transcriptional regulator